MTMLKGRQGHDSHQDALLQDNIKDLGSVISSEARGQNNTERAMVGWAIVNRMKQRHAKRVSDVWHGFSHSHKPDQSDTKLATDILTGKERDISQGATHFYTPGRMPKEGDSIPVGTDARGELESVVGVTRNGQPVRNYTPSWTRNRVAINIPGVRDSIFKFYKVPF